MNSIKIRKHPRTGENNTEMYNFSSTFTFSSLTAFLFMHYGGNPTPTHTLSVPPCKWRVATVGRPAATGSLLLPYCSRALNSSYQVWQQTPLSPELSFFFSPHSFNPPQGPHLLRRFFVFFYFLLPM